MHILWDDSCLVRLSNVSEYHINHSNQKSVILWFSRIVDYGDYVGTLLSHVDQISPHSMRKLNTVDNSSRTNDVWDVRDSSAWSCSQVEDPTSGTNTYLSHSTCNWGCDFGSVRIPNTIFNLLAVNLNTDAFLIVNRFSRDEVFSNKTLLCSSSNEYARQTMLLYKNFRPTSASGWSFLESSSLWFASESASTTLSSETSSTLSCSSFLVVELTHYIMIKKMTKKVWLFSLTTASSPKQYPFIDSRLAANYVD